MRIPLSHFRAVPRQAGAAQHLQGQVNYYAEMIRRVHALPCFASNNFSRDSAGRQIARKRVINAPDRPKAGIGVTEIARVCRGPAVDEVPRLSVVPEVAV